MSKGRQARTFRHVAAKIIARVVVITSLWIVLPIGGGLTGWASGTEMFCSPDCQVDNRHHTDEYIRTDVLLS